MGSAPWRAAGEATPERDDVERGHGNAKGDHPEAQHRQEAEEPAEYQQNTQHQPQPRGDARADAHEGASEPGAQAVGAVGAGQDQSSIASSSSMKPEIIERPLSQKAGSEASRPKGARSSLWCIEPPALSMSKYLSWKPSGFSS